MNEAHKRYLTNGSNALEADITEFDVYFKPIFPSVSDRRSEGALIIDFENALEETQHISSMHQARRSCKTPHMRKKSGLANIAERMKGNKILADLFQESDSRMKSKNRYCKDDLITFAKGFTVTGVATFLLVVFGI